LRRTGVQRILPADPGGGRCVYIPDYFRETRLDVLQAFLEQHPFATLVALTSKGLAAHHLPLRARLESAGGGAVCGHIARANTLWRELEPESEVLAVFTGADTYVSPNWYPSKAEHGKVVPTWNYATVHVRGRIRFIQDAAWLRAFVESLTNAHEHGRPSPWHVGDAPADYIEGMLRAIVGFEITVSEAVGKFKGSQNRSVADRAAVAAALRAAGRNADELAELVPGVS
jgi:transcriptional regulator